MSYTIPGTYVDPMSHVHDGIYIGSLASVKQADLRANGIKTIFNLSMQNYETNIPHFTIGVIDREITMSDLDEYIRMFSAGMREMRRCEKPILVHCSAGINRSACLIGMYLIRSGVSYDKTIEYLTAANNRRKLPVLTNQSFRRLLRAVETSMTMERLRKNPAHVTDN